MHNLYLRLRALVRFVDSGKSSFALLSTTEKLAVALVLDRADLLHEAKHTVLSAVHQIGFEWAQAAYAVQRDGWQPIACYDRSRVQAHG